MAYLYITEQGAILRKAGDRFLVEKDDEVLLDLPYHKLETDGRRNRLASALLDFGARIQESVFTANLDEQLAVRMLERIKKTIDEHWDRVHVFQLCQGCSHERWSWAQQKS